MDEFRLRTVRVGVVVTVLAVLVLVGYAVLPERPPVQVPTYAVAVVVAAAGALVVALLPWRRLLDVGLAVPLMVVWSAFDIALVCATIASSGAGHSELWGLFALTTVFFAVSYPALAQFGLFALTVTGYLTTVAVTGRLQWSDLYLRLGVLAMVWVMAAFVSAELRRVTDELRAQEGLVAVGRVAAGVAHELGNPLAVLANALYLLGGSFTDADPATRRHLQTAHRELGAASAIVANLRQFAHPHPVLPLPVELAAVVEEALTQTPPPVGTEVDVDLQAGLPSVPADHDQLVQAVRNLLANAYDAFPRQRGRVRVRAWADDRLRIAVTDDGVGIDGPGEQALAPFHGTKHKGLGLGLTVTAAIMDRHGGDIAVESGPGGTTVTLSLPGSVAAHRDEALGPA